MRYRKPDYVTNFLSICFLILLGALVHNRVYIKTIVPKEIIAAFQMPYKTFAKLQTLSQKYNIPLEEILSVYSLENKFFPNKSNIEPENEIEKNLIVNYNTIKKKYKNIRQYTRMFKNILDEIKCFPIKNGSDYIFGDSWERKTNGKIPQGCDIFDRENISGRIPIINVSDGEIANICWDDNLGYNIEVKTSSGNVYLYCCLEKFADGLEKNSKVKAGQTLGYMGKKENFVHLHFCINPKVKFADKNFFIDPYLFLRMVEAKKN